MSEQHHFAGNPLIVGAGGQVGAALASRLGPNVTATGRVPTADGSPFVDLVSLIHNPASAQDLIARLRPSVVYCVGGATNVERCESDVEWAMNTNSLGPAVLAAAAKDIPFVYFSTEYVFDGVNGPYTEIDTTNPLSVYGRSKLEGEHRILDAHPRPLILRTTVVYGPDRQEKNFLYTLQRLLSSGHGMKVPSDQISTPTYNVDLVNASAALVESGQSGIFHVCGPELLSRHEFALLAASVLGLDASLITPVSTAELNQQAPRPLRAGLLTAKLSATLPQQRMRPNREAIGEWMKQVIA